MDENIPVLDFSNLNSKDKVVRLSAARGIVKLLRAETETRRDSHNLYIIFKQLIRVLGGGDVISRQGCFSSLVGYLSLFPAGFDITVFEKIIESELQPAVGNSKQEEEETYFGQILAYGSMIISNLIFSAPEEVQKTIFDKLFQLSLQSSCLHHASFLYLSKFLIKAEKEFIPDGFLDAIKNLNDNPLDKLNYLLTLNGKSFQTSTIKSALGTESFFDLSNVSTIIDVLQKSKTSVMLGHSFVNELTSTICSHPEFFLLFWSSLINHNYIKSNTTDLITPSTSDDTVTLELCKHLLKACSKHGDLELRKSLWCESFIFILLDNVKNNKKLVQAILNQFCTCIAHAGDEVNLRVLQLTLFDLGVLNLDVLTGSETILVITNQLSFNGLRALAYAYKAVIKNGNRKISLEGEDRTIHTCLDYYTKLTSSPACYEETSWRLRQLIYLMKLGYFKQSDVHLNHELIIHAQEAFLTSLGHPFPDLEEFQTVLNRLFLKLNNLFDQRREDILIKFTDQMFEAWKKSFSLNDLINKRIEHEPHTENERELISILKILLQYMSLLILKEASTAIDNILYLNNIFVETKKGNNIIWIEVITDIFLNLLSKQNDHHRGIFRCIFKSFCSHLTQESFNQIVKVLKLSYDSQTLPEQENNSKSEETESHEINNSYGDSEVEDDEDNESKQGGKPSMNCQNQLDDFRIKVIDLIEICTEIPLPLSYWLSAAIPLIDLYAYTFGQKQLDKLKSRINCCIKKLNKSKIILENDCAEGTVTVLNELFNKISKSTGVFSNMKIVLSSMIRFILRTQKPFTKGLEEKQLTENGIFQIFKKQFEDFFYGKNNIPFDLFNSMISIGWDGILPLIPDLMHFIFDDDLEIHKRVLAIKMVEIFIKTPEFFNGHLESYYQLYLTNSAQIFNDSFTDAIENVCLNKNLNEKYYTELWSCVLAILNKQAEDSEFPEMINIEKMKDLLSTECQVLSIMKSQCKQNFEELCDLLQMSVTRTKETNWHESDSKESSEKKINDKRKNEGIFEEGMKKKAKKEVVSSN